MASDASRKRKLSYGAAPPSPRSRSQSMYDAASASTSNDLQLVNPPDLYGTTVGAEHARQSYTNTTTRDQARAHYGNHYGDVYHNVMSSSTETAEDVPYKSFMKALAFDRMDFRRAAIDPAYGETCRWAVEKEQFLRWRDPAFRGANHGFLWIRGKPGSGKSTIMKVILAHLQRHDSGCAVISFFFNARGGTLEKSIEGCYRSLLYQMLEQLPKLRTLLRITNIPSQGQSWDIAVVRDKFCEAVLHLKNERLIVMVDALDECELHEARNLVYFLDGLAVSMELQAVGFHICLASRHYPNITLRFCETLIVEDEDAHTTDIHDYVQDNLHVEPHAQRHVLLEKTMQKSQGVFMWVVLVTRRLNEQFDEGAAMAKLSSDIDALPADLNTLIQRIVSDGASDTCFLPSLVWTLAGDMDQLFPDHKEYCFAIQFSAGKLNSPHRDQSMVELDNLNAIERFVLHSSKGLVEVFEDATSFFPFQFIHESVRQHILDGGLASLHPSLGCNVEAVSHALVADWCQDYLRCDLPNYVDLPVNPSSGMFDWDTLSLTNRVDLAIASLPLLTHALHHIFDHIDAAYSGGAFDLNRLYSFPIKHWINFWNLWNNFVPREFQFVPTTSLIHLFLEQIDPACDSVMTKELLECHPKHTSVSNAESGSVGTIDQNLLFGASFDDYCGGEYGTPLVAAASCGNTACVELLLGFGADPNVCDDGSNPHLELLAQIDDSVKESNHETYELRLSALTENSMKRHSPLTAAASTSDKRLSMVKLLLDHGANVNIRAGRYGSALAIAAFHHCWNIVDLLLDHGAGIYPDFYDDFIAMMGRAIKDADQRPGMRRPSKRLIKVFLDHQAYATSSP